MIDLVEALSGKWDDGTRPADLYSGHVALDPVYYAPFIVAGLSCEDRRVQNGCAELASLLAEEHPELLLEHLSLFESNLSNPAKAIRWEAVCTLGHLSSAATPSAQDGWVTAIIPFLRDKSIVLQGHALRSLARIGAAHGEYAPRVFDAITGAADAFPRNRLGFVAEAIEILADAPEVRESARAFLEPLTTSSVSVVARKAKRALKSLSR